MLPVFCIMRRGWGYWWYPPVLRRSYQTRDGYCTGVARGWPFSPTMKTRALAGAEMPCDTQHAP